MTNRVLCPLDTDSFMVRETLGVDVQSLNYFILPLCAYIELSQITKGAHPVDHRSKDQLPWLILGVHTR